MSPILCAYRIRRALQVGVLVFVVVTLLPSGSSQAAGVSALESEAAMRSLPVAVDTAGKAVKIATSALQVVNLPVGILEVALSPLPGPTLFGGFERIFSGLAAPFELISNTLQLPLHAFRGITRRLLSTN